MSMQQPDPDPISEEAALEAHFRHIEPWLGEFPQRWQHAGPALARVRLNFGADGARPGKVITVDADDVDRVALRFSSALVARMAPPLTKATVRVDFLDGTGVELHRFQQTWELAMPRETASPDRVDLNLGTPADAIPGAMATLPAPPDSPTPPRPFTMADATIFGTQAALSKELLTMVRDTQGQLVDVVKENTKLAQAAIRESHGYTKLWADFAEKLHAGHISAVEGKSVAEIAASIAASSGDDAALTKGMEILAEAMSAKKGGKLNAATLAGLIGERPEIAGDVIEKLPAEKLPLVLEAVQKAIAARKPAA